MFTFTIGGRSLMGNVLIQQTSLLAQKIIQINGEILKSNKTLYLHDCWLVNPQTNCSATEFQLSNWKIHTNLEKFSFQVCMIRAQNETYTIQKYSSDFVGGKLHSEMFNSCRFLDTPRWLIRVLMLTPDWTVLAYKSPTVVKQSDSPGGGRELSTESSLSSTYNNWQLWSGCSWEE